MSCVPRLGLILIVAACQACDEPKAAPAPRPVAPPPPEPAVLDGVDGLALGLEHGCVLRAGRVYCWGELLDGGATSAVAFELAALPPVVTLESAGRRACVLGEDGDLYCWGERLGDDATRALTDTSIRWGRLARLDFGVPITRIAVGMTHACAITEKRDLYCWGSASGGQLTMPNPMERPELVAEDVVEVEVGHGWTCFVAGDKQTCRGPHPHMTGLTQQENVQFPGWVIAACGVSAERDVFCEGRAPLVYAGKQMPADPGGERVKIDGLDDVVELALGAMHACVRRGDGTVWCWGDNSFEQVPGATSTAPVQIALPGPARRVEAGLYHACALLERGDVVCWGSNRRGQSGKAPLSPIRFEPASGTTPPPPTIVIASAIERYALRATPTPTALAGTTWKACLVQDHDPQPPCGVCQYTLRFEAPRFVAEGTCPSLKATTSWSGTWKRTGDTVLVREKPAPSGVRWEWELALHGTSLVGQRRVIGEKTHSRVTGSLL